MYDESGNLVKTVETKADGTTITKAESNPPTSANAGTSPAGVNSKGIESNPPSSLRDTSPARGAENPSPQPSPARGEGAAPRAGSSSGNSGVIYSSVIPRFPHIEKAVVDGVKNIWKQVTGKISSQNKTVTIDEVIQEARKQGALVEEIAPGEYKISQKIKFNDGKAVPAGHDATEYSIETVATYKNGNAEPAEVVRYHKNEPVVQIATMDDSGNVTLSLYDRQTELGVEFCGYNRAGEKVAGQKQTVRIINKDNKVLKEYTGEDVENARLVPRRNTTDEYSAPLLNVERAVDNYGLHQNIVEWQAIDGTEYLISSGKQYKPENYTRALPKDKINTNYQNVTSECPAFAEKMGEYNEYAKARNLTIEESGSCLLFKNEKGKVVREITSDGQKILRDRYIKLDYRGNEVQSCVTDGNGNILERTVTEYRQWWGKASTITLDYRTGKAHSGLYLDGKLTQPETHELEQGIALFRTIAGYN